MIERSPQIPRWSSDFFLLGVFDKSWSDETYMDQPVSMMILNIMGDVYIDPRWASLDRIRGVWPKTYPGPLGPISYTNGAPTSPREFYPKTPFKTSYIHLPSLHEFYLPALASKILYSLTWCLWILFAGTCPKILYSLKNHSIMNFIPKKSFHFPGGQGHEIYEHEKPCLCWQDFFLTLCPKILSP